MADFYSNMTKTGNLSVDQTAFERLAYFALRPELYYDQFADVRATNATWPAWDSRIGVGHLSACITRLGSDLIAFGRIFRRLSGRLSFTA